MKGWRAAVDYATINIAYQAVLFKKALEKSLEQAEGQHDSRDERMEKQTTIVTLTLWAERNGGELSKKLRVEVGRKKVAPEYRITQAKLCKRGITGQGKE